jgi:hypothetical protein
LDDEVVLFKYPVGILELDRDHSHFSNV